jgi:hypothetical protein
VHLREAAHDGIGSRSVGWQRCSANDAGSQAERLHREPLVEALEEPGQEGVAGLDIADAG